MAKTHRPDGGGSAERLERLAAILEEMKAEEIVALDMRAIVDYTDFLLIATTRSPAHARAITQAVERALRAEGVRPYLPVEDESPQWVIMDHGDVVVHLMEAQTRRHYRLEGLWGDAESIALQGRASA